MAAEGGEVRCGECPGRCAGLCSRTGVTPGKMKELQFCCSCQAICIVLVLSPPIPPPRMGEPPSHSGDVFRLCTWYPRLLSAAALAGGWAALGTVDSKLLSVHPSASPSCRTASACIGQMMISLPLCIYFLYIWINKVKAFKTSVEFLLKINLEFINLKPHR